MNDPDLRLLLVILLAAAAAGAAWYFWDDIAPVGEPSTAPYQKIVPEEESATGPRHPIAPLSVSGASNVELVPLPRLDESDDYFLLALAELLGPGVERLLVNDALIDNVVATIDNLPRDHVAEKIRPVGQLTGPFSVDEAPGNGVYYQNADNALRYDILLGVIANTDIEAAVAMYRRFYPLMQESYQRLGYPNAYFNDRVVEVIDHLLATPEPPEPVPLVRPHVLFEYADPELEALSSGQKLMLRMGNAHATTIKAALAGIRSQIASDQHLDVVPGEN